ncbi:MAG: N-6 DNA methylase [Thermoplasmatales archaeon]|nr:N-6 DNA methylase [Thermoplasmatales archaeon]
MANERITEDIVRKHFNSYPNECIIEEQKSSNPKIDKLLKYASKKGGGKGLPEFIISLKNNPDFIIVVECKANIAKHQSSTLDKYDEYAVDGALLYASFLSKEYDVLAIGVSGQNVKELKVSHYLYLKGEKKAVPIFGNKLLDIESYINGYLKSPEKFRQDYNTLLDFSRKLNVELHHHKIPEKDRALLISSILIALDDKAFRKAYKYKEPEELTNFLVDTVSNVLRKANLFGKRLDNLNIQFSFIRTNASLSTKKDVLRNLIDSIDEDINKFTKTHEYYDVLGQLYIEFLRYANSDTGLGIVLTPPHITELFSELTGVNKDSVVYDNCAGTGGFLISAMRKMIEDAKGDLEKEKEIKSKQIIGVEYQANIFALACSNMYIHQDGKTNIINGDCFETKIMEQVKKYKPTVGFLNPPYQVDKKKDTEELEFVLNNLEVLQQGGTCIAIAPMQCALAQKGEKYELKKQLLQKHTLEVVLLMPDELFYNSDVNEVTCVMIFTAHKPHLPNKETYFGYYKDDGFVKRKDRGRIDAFLKWEKSIKAEWVSSYINKKAKPGFSVNKIVTANDEWCAEAYMETDFSRLNKEKFEKQVKEYVVHSLRHGHIKNVSEEPISFNLLSLNINGFESFKIGDLFDIKKGERLVKEKRIEGDIPLITATSENNGVVSYISYDEFKDSKKVLSDKITIDMFFNVFYHGYKYFSDDNVHTLIQKNISLNNYVCLFLVTVLRELQYKYAYGRQLRIKRLKFDEIKLPIDKEGKPDWQFMEDYIKSLPYSSSI